MEILFFYSSCVPESLRAKSCFTGNLKNNLKSKNIRVKNIDIIKESTLCKNYKIHGVPTLLVLNNKKVLVRMLGELKESELNLLITEISNKT